MQKEVSHRHLHASPGTKFAGTIWVKRHRNVSTLLAPLISGDPRGLDPGFFWTLVLPKEVSNQHVHASPGWSGTKFAGTIWVKRRRNVSTPLVPLISGDLRGLDPGFFWTLVLPKEASHRHLHASPRGSGTKCAGTIWVKRRRNVSTPLVPLICGDPRGLDPGFFWTLVLQTEVSHRHLHASPRGSGTIFAGTIWVNVVETSPRR